METPQVISLRRPVFKLWIALGIKRETIRNQLLMRRSQFVFVSPESTATPRTKQVRPGRIAERPLPVEHRPIDPERQPGGSDSSRPPGLIQTDGEQPDDPRVAALITWVIALDLADHKQGREAARELRTYGISICAIAPRTPWGEQR